MRRVRALGGRSFSRVLLRFDQFRGVWGPSWGPKGQGFHHTQASFTGQSRLATDSRSGLNTAPRHSNVVPSKLSHPLEPPRPGTPVLLPVLLPSRFSCYSKAPPAVRPCGATAYGVGLGRLELPTSRLSGVRSNQLSYRPCNNLRMRCAMFCARTACSCLLLPQLTAVENDR